jgi:hypothetical protein
MDVLSLSATEARAFFLKEESYFTFDLPPYFRFGDLLKLISIELCCRPLFDLYLGNSKPQDFEGVNYK